MGKSPGQKLIRTMSELESHLGIKWISGYNEVRERLARHEASSGIEADVGELIRTVNEFKSIMSQLKGSAQDFKDDIRGAVTRLEEFSENQGKLLEAKREEECAEIEKKRDEFNGNLKKANQRLKDIRRTRDEPVAEARQTVNEGIEKTRQLYSEILERLSKIPFTAIRGEIAESNARYLHIIRLINSGAAKDTCFMCGESVANERGLNAHLSECIALQGFREIKKRVDAAIEEHEKPETPAETSSGGR